MYSIRYNTLESLLAAVSPERSFAKAMYRVFTTSTGIVTASATQQATPLNQNPLNAEDVAIPERVFFCAAVVMIAATWDDYSVVRTQTAMQRFVWLEGGA